jgi:hypothetical protein
MTMQRFTILGCVLLGGCYSGVAGDRGGPAANDDDDTAVDSVGEAGDESSEDPPRLPHPDPLEPGFEVPASEVELLPFHVRMQNLAAVTGQKLDHPMFLELWERRYALGDHDYSQLVAPDLKWSPERMEGWVRGIKPVCDDPAFQVKYPDLATDPTKLIREAFARDATADEIAAYSEVTAGQLDGAGRYRMVCLAVLTSLDFVAR